MDDASPSLPTATAQHRLPRRLAEFLEQHAVTDDEIVSLFGAMSITGWGMLRKKKGKSRRNAKAVLRKWIVSKAGLVDQGVMMAIYNQPYAFPETPKIEQAAKPTPAARSAKPPKSQRTAKKRATTARPKRASIYNTSEWKRLRFDALAASPRCLLCGASPEIGAVLNVDHVKPVATHPHLALDPSNLQVLCASCNWGKGNKPGDFRPPPAED